jgi:hypothetical protein
MLLPRRTIKLTSNEKSFILSEEIGGAADYSAISSRFRAEKQNNKNVFGLRTSDSSPGESSDGGHALFSVVSESFHGDLVGRSWRFAKNLVRGSHAEMGVDRRLKRDSSYR